MTFQSAEAAAALDYAKRRIEEIRETPIEIAFGQSVNLLDPGDGEKYAARHFAQFLLAGQINPAQAAAEAAAGEPLFYSALAILAAAELKGEIRLAEPLRSHVIGALSDLPKLKLQQRRKESFYFRDVFITTLVQEIRDRFGLYVTGRSAKQTSACAIASKAMGMGYDSVRKIYYKFGRQI